MVGDAAELDKIGLVLGLALLDYYPGEGLDNGERDKGLPGSVAASKGHDR